MRERGRAPPRPTFSLSQNLQKPNSPSTTSTTTAASDAIPAFVPARLVLPPLMPALVVTPSAHSFTAGHTPGRVAWSLPVAPPPPPPPLTEGDEEGTSATAATPSADGVAGGQALSSSSSTTSTSPAPGRFAYTSLAQFGKAVELYRGGVSTVSSAVCARTGRPVILKAYDTARMRSRHAARVGREVAAMAALGPGGGVVSLLGHFEAPPTATTTATAATQPPALALPRRGASGGPVLVMEHCARGDLFRALVLAGAGGGLGGTYTAAAVVGPLLATLARAHAAGWVHRDIKPENLFVAADGRVLLGDWGLAMHTHTEPAFARAGTLDYMAPEVLGNPATDLEEGSPGATPGALAAAGVRPYGPAADVWAVGVLAYELVTGRPPFEAASSGGGAGGRDEGATAARILHSTALAWPATLAGADGAAAGAGPAWVAFVRACLAKDPARRPAAADALRLPWVASHFVAPAGGGGEAGHFAAAARPASASVVVAPAGGGMSSVLLSSSAAAPPPPPPGKKTGAPLFSKPFPQLHTHALLLSVAGSADGEATAEGRGGFRVRVAHYFHRQRAAGGARVGGGGGGK